MPGAATAASDLFQEEEGAGEPLVLVHGSWSETFTWSLAMPGLAGGLRALGLASRRGAAPQAELVTIDGAGHLPHQTHPGEYAEIISSFALDSKGTEP
jgi:pimeloyl-ACP methyl ester carboxylesterase